MVSCSPVYKPLYSLAPEVRYIHLWGGRSRGGSFAATDYALFYLSQPGYFRGYLMRYIAKDVRESLWRDMMDRIDEKEAAGLLHRQDYKINTNDMSIVHLPTGNTLRSRGFKKSSNSQTARMKSIAGATHIFLEEAEEVGFDDFNQLDDSLRTVKSNLRVFLIFNPPKKNHWLIDEYYTLTEARIAGYYVARPKVRDNFLSIFSTYHDNIKFVAKSTVEKFEGYRLSDPNWYWTVVRGLISEGAKGRIYSGWKPCTTAEFNALPYTSYFVLDFGFSNDPLALSEVKRHNKQRWAKELIYETGISDDELVRRLRAFKVGNRPIVADSAEPKSIAFLRSKGFNVIAARKIADSIRFGIKTMQGLQWHYTQESKNIAYEYQEYRWDLDADKNLTDKPVPKYDHCFPAGTMVATGNGFVPIEKVQSGDTVLTRAGFRRVSAAGITGFNSQVFEYEVQGRKIRCTPDHLIYTQNRGFIRAELLTNCDTLTILDEEKYKILWLSNSSTIATLPIVVTPTQSGFLTDGILPETQRKTENTPANSCIGGFGLTIMDQYPKATTFIIKMATPLIMSLITWWLCLRLSTYRSTAKPDGCKPMRADNTPKPFAPWLRNGTKRKRVKSGILNMLSAFRKLFNRLINSVFIAESLTKPKIVEDQSSSALTPVNRLTDVRKTATYQNGNVMYVEPCFQSIATPKHAHAPQLVKATYCGNHVVYDLTIEGQPEFFADGILVHNCMDGLRYGEITDPWGGGPIEVE